MLLNHCPALPTTSGILPQLRLPQHFQREQRRENTLNLSARDNAAIVAICLLGAVAAFPRNCPMMVCVRSVEPL